MIRFAFIFLFFFSRILVAQTRIELLNANKLEFDKNRIDAKRLIGNVSFQHEQAVMYCDSAYLFANNQVDAFANIKILQGDTLQMYGNFLHYDGNTKIAELTKDVRLIDKEMSLTSAFLRYDLNSGLASYNGNGKIINKENTLTSSNGYYYSKSKDFYFKKNVVLVNPQYIVKCDTLKYNTLSEIAYFLSPTKIISKENSIYCENGWYDTKLDIAQFNKHASLKNPKQELTGDSLYYNRNLGYGKAIGSIEMNDSTENITIKGDFGEYFENDDNTIVTGHALLIQKFDIDTLFLHADILRLTNDSALSKSLESKLKKVVKAGKSVTNNKKEKKIVKAREMNRSDSKRVLMAYNKVKFYKNDLQGKCDSLVFTYRDSTMRLFTAPIIWSDINQLTADSINIHTYQGIIKSMDLKKNSFIASKEDSIGYNQICGKNMKGHFTQNKLSKMDVFGNGQTIYYAQDKDGIIGVNKTVCSNMVIKIKDNKVISILFVNKPDANIYPMNELSPKDLLLPNFGWYDELRPKSKADLFK